jgi:hypothetical protein
MSQTVQANPLALLENVVRNLPPGARDDFRILIKNVVLDNLTHLSPGGNLLQAGGPQAGGSATPTGVVFSVTGSGGYFTVNITDPGTAQQGSIWHELSYSPLASFTKDVITLPATTGTHLSIPGSGVSAFWRMRTSFDRKTWSNYQLASTTAINAGLVESAAMSAAAAFNQTNYGVVNSQALGGAAAVTISGPGGNLTAYTALRGTSQAIRPSATIVGVAPESEQFVGWDGSQFQLKPTLAAVLADNLEPVGKVSVVSTATPTLPVIDPIITGGQVIGYNVISGGSGASQPYTLTFGSVGSGVGATFGVQTIIAGVLISIAPGNPGVNYSGGTTVTASGGSGGGQSGGGTTAGGNGGRMTAV